MTRITTSPQLHFGQTAIADIQFDLKSRDDIPRILQGLQYIYVTENIRKPIFDLLEEKISPNISKDNGRPGMMLWTILVMGVLRLDLNCDYDRLHELVNNHRVIRQMLGHSDILDPEMYNLRTIKDNVGLLTPELLNAINEVIVDAGHGLLNKKKDETLRGRCDSFVVETNVHYPTDINLLFDAVRKIIQLTSELSCCHGFSDWRQYKQNIKQLKKGMRKAGKMKRIAAKEGSQQEEKARKVKKAHRDYVALSQQFMEKSKRTREKINITCKDFSLSDIALIDSIGTFMEHAERQNDQIIRRVLEGEAIPHEEKVFSIFQPHTEWICKGKAGIPVELGLRVCILEDQHQFILHHQVMQKQTDDKVAISMVRGAKKAFPNLKSCSTDKAFHSPENQAVLSDELDVVAIKRKGKLSKKSKEIENSEAFKKASEKHSAVESAINALEVHGLNKCLDHGIDGFKRYVALAVTARNIHRIGDLLHQKRQAKMKRKRKRSLAA